VPGQDDLSDVLKKLKDADVMQGPQVGIAQSYMNFRNHALHANWDKIEKESIHSVLGSAAGIGDGLAGVCGDASTVASKFQLASLAISQP